MRNILKNVCIQGLGYVGAASLVAVANARAKTGRALYKVIGIDLDTKEGLKELKQSMLENFHLRVMINN